MRKPALIVLALCALPLITSPAFAGGSSLYWYNGDPDLTGDLINETGLSIGNALVYDNFVVGAGGANLTGVFSNDSLQATPRQNPSSNERFSSVLGLSTATWQIRTGVSVGNGGTLVASGDSAATFTDTGHFTGGEIYTVEVDGLNLNLLAGTYWLTVAPDISDGQTSYLDRTAGVNAVGSPMAQDGNSFINSAGLGVNFAAATNLASGSEGDGGFLDFSEGVVVAASATPEPASVVSGLTAAIFLGFVMLVRKSRNRLAPAGR